MQRVIVFVSWILFSILFQTVIAPHFPSSYVWTDLLFYLVIILALRYSLRTGIIVAAIIGYVFDTISYVPYGTTIISYVAVLIFIRKVRANIYFETRVALFCWIIVFSLFKQILQLGFTSIVTGGIVFRPTIIFRLLLQSGWDAALGLVALPIIEKLLYTDWRTVFRRKGIRDR